MTVGIISAVWTRGGKENIHYWTPLRLIVPLRPQDRRLPARSRRRCCLIRHAHARTHTHSHARVLPRSWDWTAGVCATRFTIKLELWAGPIRSIRTGSPVHRHTCFSVSSARLRSGPDSPSRLGASAGDQSELFISWSACLGLKKHPKKSGGPAAVSPHWAGTLSRHTGTHRSRITLREKIK